MTYHPTNKYIGNKLKSLRVNAGITQTELGKLIGVTFQQIQKYEKGISAISCKTLQEMCHIFNIPLSCFFDNIEQNPFQDNLSSIQLMAAEGDIDSFFLRKKKAEIEETEVQMLIRAFSSIEDPSIRKNLLFLIESIANNS